MMAPPDPAAPETDRSPDNADGRRAKPTGARPDEVAAPPAKPPRRAESAVAAIAVQQHAQFGVDLGGANSVDGLRALWRGLMKSNAGDRGAAADHRDQGRQQRPRHAAPAGRRPADNAAAAAKFCAALAENERHCETTVFDGQRLSMRGGRERQPAQKPRRTGSHAQAARRSGDSPQSRVRGSR